VDVAFFEVDNTDFPDVNQFVGLVDVRDIDDDIDDLDIIWNSPVGCGNIEASGNRLDWSFTNSDYDECLGNGLSVTVDDGTNVVTESFFDVFVDVGLVDEPPEPVENQPPEIVDVSGEWLNNMEDDPHLYDLTLYATDADGDSLTYEWTSVTCGELTAGTSSQVARWEYAVADMELCGMAQVTVEVSDGTDTVEGTLSVF